MKNKLLSALAVLLGISLFSARAADREKISVEKTITVHSDADALKATADYMRQGAGWITISPPLHLFTERTPGEWEVKATFYR